MSITITIMTGNAVVDMTMIMSMSITITMTMSVAADMTMSMSIITTMTMSAVVDIITIIMQTKYSPAGDVRPLRSSQERDWRRCWRAFPLLKSMA